MLLCMLLYCCCSILLVVGGRGEGGGCLAGAVVLRVLRCGYPGARRPRSSRSLSAASIGPFFTYGHRKRDTFLVHML